MIAIAFTKTATVAVVDVTMGGTTAESLKEKFAEIGKQDSAKALEELRDKIRDAVNVKLKSLGKNRVVVFVDDLDRLAPEKAVELLEVLKIFMDVPNCVFVLAVDYGVVTQGLEKKFGVSVGHSKGKSFFDKIIQLPFAIPIAQYNISAYIQNLLSNMNIACSGEEINTYREIVDYSIGCNPRGMKRLFNSFILLNTVATKKRMFDGTDGIKVKDKQRILFAALCLQMAFQEIYEFMIKNKNDLDTYFFEGIKDLEKLKTDGAFEEIRKNIPIKEELYYSKIADFMELFYNSLQLNNDLENLSDEELSNLKNILSFSAITANAPPGKIQPQTGRTTNNTEFWKYFLDKIKGRSVLFQSISPSSAGWLASGGGVGGITYVVAVHRKSVTCSLSLYRSIKDENKKIFDDLEKSKAEIETKMGKPLEWRRMNDKKGSNIDSETTGIDVYNRGDWPRITEFLIEEINKMENVFGEYLKGYKARGEVKSGI
ncbi:DUF4268 domain-containing protein [Candidatus Contendibacter odensensis]|uniref:KAP NTPase domain-containing protein n=1 Tax=Candidatus Contendobacter odensis Run_B_J11 TaxID=1400861 RepID=A0A7U7J5G7_9GAMM|nr:DUF4268 domain-containing protein [Candidatus Contendobacter odensis]CDH47270.1 hypothetical protein BN874_770120 [Candidatus Contendobacter odensis Run_B_J11]